MKNHFPSLFSVKKVKRSEVEVKEDLQRLKKKIAVDEKALEDLELLIGMYERAQDEKGLHITEKKKKEIVAGLESLKKERKALKEQLAPRPLPQPEFVRVSALQSHAPPMQLGLAQPHILLPPPQLIVPPPISPDSAVASPVSPPSSSPAQGEAKATDHLTHQKSVALFDYAATRDDELSFAYGDVIEVISQQFQGWWTGQLEGKVGLFPANYVQLVTDEGEPVQDTSTSVNGGDLKMSSSYAEALADYTQNYGDELSFSKGDIIHITELHGGWYRGTLQSVDSPKLVPSNLVQLISEEEALFKLAKEVERKQEERSSSQGPPAKRENAANEPMNPPPAFPHQRQKEPETSSENAPLLGNQSTEKKGSQSCNCVIL